MLLRLLMFSYFVAVADDNAKGKKAEVTTQKKFHLHRRGFFGTELLSRFMPSFV
jgi:hypothetical protein